MHMYIHGHSFKLNAETHKRPPTHTPTSSLLQDYSRLELTGTQSELHTLVIDRNKLPQKLQLS